MIHEALRRKHKVVDVIWRKNDYNFISFIIPVVGLRNTNIKMFFELVLQCGIFEKVLPNEMEF